MLTKAKNKKRLVPLFVVIVVLGAVLAAYFTFSYLTKSIWPFFDDTQGSSEQQRGLNDINYGPPTEQEVIDSQDGKKNSEENTNQSTDNISVDIAYIGKSDDNNHLEIRAFTADVIEGDGKCTAIVSKGNSKVTGESVAFIDARSSICTPIEIPLSKLSPGKWDIEVTYLSPKSTGKSSLMEVNI